ncbi:MAG: protein-L-isoaspartate(D-aspartate) O-methyltransferase [Planctomycetia bacterium]|jgi:protein-L-isoaspartate(D-aspartate) O-methyltransferase
MKRAILLYLTKFAALAAVVTLFLLGQAARADTKAFEEARNRMVDEEIVSAGIKNTRVIRSMRTTPRHEFVPMNQRRYAYLDMALPIGDSQTISPPFIVAYMTEALDPQPTDKVLEIGTGSGYQAAVLSPLVQSVYSIEIVEPLAKKAAATLKKLKYNNVHTKHGDGFLGWKEHAPFDKIIVTCSPERVPKNLFEQLKEGGRIVVPVGERYQQILYLLKKEKGKLVSEKLAPTLFVPMTGLAEERRKVQPDPTNPSIVNGDFEESLGEGDKKKPAGWHYQRQLVYNNDKKSPSGFWHVTFKNSEMGRGSQALQGFAVDGRKVKRLQVSISISGKELRHGRPGQTPKMAIMFYDEKRNPLGTQTIGPWRGSFGWMHITQLVPVPVRAREAILVIGLFGATGELNVDNIELGPAT